MERRVAIAVRLAHINMVGEKRFKNLETPASKSQIHCEEQLDCKLAGVRELAMATDRERACSLPKAS